MIVFIDEKIVLSHTMCMHAGEASVCIDDASHTMCMHACEASVCIDVVAVAFAILFYLVAVAVAV